MKMNEYRIPLVVAEFFVELFIWLQLIDLCHPHSPFPSPSLSSLTRSLSLSHRSLSLSFSNFLPLITGTWPPYASYLTLETARLTKVSPKGGAVPHGIVGELYVRAVYNDNELVMEGCGGEMWCPYELFRKQALKWSISHSSYIKECRNT